MSSRVNLAGSAPSHEDGGEWLPADPGQQITITVMVRRPAGTADIGERLLAGARPFGSRDEAEKAMMADGGDLQAVRTFAQRHGLKVVLENAPARTVQLSGTIAQMGQAFGVSIKQRREPGRDYLSYRGDLTLPKSLEHIVQAVLGMDQRPIARHHEAG